ncbi:MAG: hypothetical protein IT405_03325 [Candidatus Yanofskybacteria bacterium]|nr:hypothetical protein [Candidatus Yanofskybacteria bacterium]
MNSEVPVKVKIFSTRKDRETLNEAVMDLESQLDYWESKREEDGFPIRITGASTSIAYHPISLNHPRAHVMATLTVTYELK